MMDQPITCTVTETEIVLQLRAGEHRESRFLIEPDLTGKSLLVRLRHHDGELIYYTYSVIDQTIRRFREYCTVKGVMHFVETPVDDAMVHMVTGFVTGHMIVLAGGMETL